MGSINNLPVKAIFLVKGNLGIFCNKIQIFLDLNFFAIVMFYLRAHLVVIVDDFVVPVVVDVVNSGSIQRKSAG